MDAVAKHQRPLQGLSAWIITTGAAGMDTQTRGVADALGVAYEMKPIAPRGLYKLLAPWGPVAPGERIGEGGSTFAPPWPDVAIGLGRSAVPYLRAIRRQSPATFTLQLLDTRAGLGAAEVIWVPQHDPLRGANVITTLTAPHGFTAERLAALRAAMPADIAALPVPRVAVILGGKNAVYDFRAEDDARFAGALKSLGGQGEGPNPYPQFLAQADALVVTADSVNMTGEAAATGRPVLVFTPSAGSAKFRRFHAALEAQGATRPLPDRVAEFPRWSYPPLFSADEIAREVERRWLGRQAKR